MKANRTKAWDISKKVKGAVWERDNHCCVLCGTPAAMPNAHYVPRSKGGLGIIENIITLCIECHRQFDQSSARAEIKERLRNYLKLQHPDWDEQNLIYKGKNL